jgi:plasmid stabilization system protein ParE
MVRKIIWSYQAQFDRKKIIEYWNKRNLSNVFSIKLNSYFIRTLRLLSKYPFIGRKTEIEDVRVKIIRDYLIIYKITPLEIVVLTIWDGRQNPEDLKRFLKKTM